VSTDSDSLRDALRHAVAPRYEVEHEIGRGGMAFVYRGCDSADHGPVAFKVLRPEYAASLGATRFHREIRLLSQLHHPGILPLLDSGSAGTLTWFVMPLVEGETLQARLRREGQLTFDLVQSVVTQVAAALDYAHDAGVIHRDIKPSNLFLAGDRVLVADFGIAKDVLRHDAETTTSTDVVVGTVLYMSPEQADSHAHADRRTDVYALGCVAYEMLAGEPPFTGPNVQAVMARLQLAPAPSVRLLRPGLHRGVDVVLRKALAKSPADRYQRAGDFASALTDPAKLEVAAREARREEEPTRRRRWPFVAALAVMVGVFVALLWPDRPLDANKVVVFPLGETPAEATMEGTGAVVALMLGSALEYTEPLEWIDGLPRLEARLRKDAAQLTAGEARKIARAAGARWYLDGSVIRRGDSVTVILRLNDAAGDSVIGRASASRVAVEPAQAGLEAVNQLLPRLLSPGQRVGELSALADRRPAAVAMWLQGEREYRSFNFARALEFERRAVHEDSALAIAAVRGAQAANWLNATEEASAFADAAVRHVALLPDRVAPFARGLHAYLDGRADSAVFWLTRALETSPHWTEAHMALGEVYYHLLPTAGAPLQALAESAFTAAAADSGFSPPRFHLAELAIRSRDTTRAARAVADFLRLSEDASSAPQRTELRLMLGCARSGRADVPWGAAATRAPLEVLAAAKLLAGGGTYPGCAEEGFRAVFDHAESLGDRWGGFLGWQGVLAAEGRTSELRAAVDSAVARGLDLATQLYVLDALAGADVAAEAAPLAARTAADPKAPSFALWLAGEWHAAHSDRAAVRTVRDALAARAAGEPGGDVGPYAAALSARLALLEGDSAGAIGRLREMLATAPQKNLDWGLGGSLAPDRLLLAELLLARGQPQDAILAAGIFDHPVAAVFLPFLPASLELRSRAAVTLGQAREAKAYADRLAALGATERLSSASRSSTPEAP
jgi:tRNA A-37 threonylcarbamoyl transferase component Bud32